MGTIDVLNLPSAELAVLSADSNIDFTDADVDPKIILEQARKLQQENAQQYVDVCKVKPWWDCNAQESGGVCHLNSSNQCVPIGLLDQSAISYYQRWREIYTPLYENVRTHFPRNRVHSLKRESQQEKPQQKPIAPKPQAKKESFKQQNLSDMFHHQRMSELQ